MKSIIIYQGQYGSTEQYAKWIGEELKIDAISVKKTDLKKIQEHDLIIFGSSVIAYKLLIAKWLNKNWTKFSNKKIYLFSVSGVSPEKQEKLQEFLDNSISKDIQDNMKYSALHGRMIFKELPLFIQLMMKMVGNMQKNPKIRKKFTEDYDYVKRENIIPIVNEIKKII